MPRGKLSCAHSLNLRLPAPSCAGAVAVASSATARHGAVHAIATSRLGPLTYSFFRHGPQKGTGRGHPKRNGHADESAEGSAASSACPPLGSSPGAPLLEIAEELSIVDSLGRRTDRLHRAVVRRTPSLLQHRNRLRARTTFAAGRHRCLGAANASRSGTTLPALTRSQPSSRRWPPIRERLCPGQAPSLSGGVTERYMTRQPAPAKPGPQSIAALGRACRAFHSPTDHGGTVETLPARGPTGTPPPPWIAPRRAAPSGRRMRGLCT